MSGADCPCVKLEVLKVVVLVAIEGNEDPCEVRIGRILRTRPVRIGLLVDETRGVGDVVASSATQFAVEQLAEFVTGGAVITANSVAGGQAPLVTAAVVDAVQVIGEGYTAPPSYSPCRGIEIVNPATVSDALCTPTRVVIARGDGRNLIDQIGVGVVQGFEQVGVLGPGDIADAAVDQVDAVDSVGIQPGSIRIQGGDAQQDAEGQCGFKIHVYLLSK